MTIASNVKVVEALLSGSRPHWVGDGFPVATMLSPQSADARLSPFVLFDYAGPAAFEPASASRGVDSHPHRGFETVTVVFQGELEHRDSAGNSGSIGPGDVQWMTAASGVLHEEKHSKAFTRRGGVLEMAQLWVNLPARHKMDAPRYQDLRDADIPRIELPRAAGYVRVISGPFHDADGPARTVTPVILWDVRLRRGAALELPIPDGHTGAVFVRNGSVRFDDSSSANARQLAVLSRAGAGAMLHVDADVELLVIGGQPIDEPCVAYGPFVMNTQLEIERAISDYRAGRFGSL